jgi:DMSO/TMAO reductase YedYZ heme-binding membrane subunit
MKTTAVLVIALLLTAAASALPDSSTHRSGNLCEMAHPFKYSYSFSYGKNMELGKTTEFNITFTLMGTQVARNPYTVGVEIEASGFEVSETSFQLTANRKTITLRPLTENPSLILKTTLTLNGDESPHRGYTATYADNFTLNSFNVAIQGSTSSTLPTSTTTTAQGSTSSTLAKTTTSIPATTTSATSAATEMTMIEIIIEQTEPSPAPWYIVRAAGLIAYLFLSLSVAIGLLKKMNPKRFTSLFRHHCDISYLALIFAFFHMMNTLLDKYQWNLSLDDILFPGFSSNIRIMLSAGVLAFYLMLAITLSSTTPKIMTYLKRRRWHLLHLSSYLMYAIVVVHSFILGTDTGNSLLNDIQSTLIYAGFWLLAAANLILFTYFLTTKIKKK